MSTVSTMKELGQQIEEGQNNIEVEADLKNQVIKIKAAGPVAWGVCAACLGAAIVAIIAAPATGGTSAIVGSVALAPAVGILGASAVTGAIALGVAGDGLATLNKLRKYSVTHLPNGKLLLKK